MVRKAKSCYNCPAHSLNNRRSNNGGCLLGYSLVYDKITDMYSPKECCHKPKTVKEFSKRWLNKFDQTPKK